MKLTATTSVIIIGGGPSGLMTAYQLQLQNIPYILIEKNSLLGKKLLITGSSRCNVTNNRNTKEFLDDLTIKHKRFLYSTLSSFGPEAVISFMEHHNVPLVLENNFKYFPKSNRSIDVLKAISKDLKGDIRLNTTVNKVSKNNQFLVETSRGNFESDYLVIATGSQSFPKTGSTGDGLNFAKSFGHKTIPFYPAETNIYSRFFAKNKEYIQGISFSKSVVRIQGSKQTFEGALLFTHNGVSGPVIQHASEFIYFSLKNGPVNIECSLTEIPEQEIIDMLHNEENKDTFVLQILNKLTIKRLAKFILQHLKIDNKKISTISKKDKQRIINSLVRFEIAVDRVEAKENAYVNGGGVETKELDPKSFESKLVAGLFFIGETVDIHGPIGGYNITLAFSSGYSAAKKINNYFQNK